MAGNQNEVDTSTLDDEITQNTLLFNKHVQTPETTKTRPKLEYLDGIRGWAALSVAIFHLFGYIYRDLDFNLPSRPPIQTFIFRFFIWTGRLSVTIFFVLSGRVIALSYLNTKKPERLVSSMIRRPFRLFIPVLISYLFHYILQVFNLKNPNMEKAQGLIKPGLNWFKPLSSKTDMKNVFDLFQNAVLLFVPPYQQPRFSPIIVYWTIPFEYFFLT
jgi:peptidoglycan/LPS O-acetylase OafA/YrhL